MRRKRIDLFAFGIAYNDPTDFGANEDPEPLYNGNISQVQWNTASVNTTNNPVSERYSYGYDALNRITSATDNTGHYNLTGILYDKNGNIGSLERKGHTAVDGTGQVTSFTGSMDDLDYGYFNNGASNRLYKVRDDGNDGYGFKDGTGDTQDYWYDANGNLTRDLNKGIGTASTDGIEYNHLNLPTKIEMGSEDISYVYDAAGTKIQKTVSTGSSVTDYAGNFVYQGGTLQFFGQPEGYVTPDGQGGYDYVYQYKDHLGNIRLSYVDDGNGGLEIVEENNYYPFGLKHKGYNDNGISSLGNDVAQKWKFGGKEYEDGLNESIATYDFGARNYDPALGRWFVVDALAEDPNQIDKSPYAYAWNNPIYYTDPDGNCPECPWYLNDTPSGRGRVLTLGLHNIKLSSFERKEGKSNFFSNALKSAWNGIAATWNTGMEGANMGDITSEGLGQTAELADRVIEGDATQEDYENIVAAGAMMVIRGKSKSIGKKSGSGPTAGVLEVSSARKSANQFKNFSPSSAVEFVFDPTTETFAVGKVKNSTSGLSPHQNLVKSIDGASSSVGGMFKRGTNGEIMLNEGSGHYHQNWTPEIRAQLMNFLENQTGQSVIHTEGPTF